MRSMQAMRRVSMPTYHRGKTRNVNGSTRIREAWVISLPHFKCVGEDGENKVKGTMMVWEHAKKKMWWHCMNLVMEVKKGVVASHIRKD